MSDMPVVIGATASVLRLDQRTLRVDFADGAFKRFPLRLIDQIVVEGNPKIEAALCRRLSELGISMALSAARGKAAVAWLGAGLGNHVELRANQHRVAFDSAQRRPVARHFVRRKIDGYECSALAPRLDTTLQDALREARHSAANATDVPQLLGVEGAISKAWLAALGGIIPDAWGFRGRSRRPPTDPVNALLSLAYTLLHGSVEQKIAASGLDPYIGFLHESYRRRAALPLDVMEPLRPLVDAFVIQQLAHLDADRDFTATPQEGCRVSAEPRRHFYREWYAWRETVACNGHSGLGALIDAEVSALTALLAHNPAEEPAAQ